MLNMLFFHQRLMLWFAAITIALAQAAYSQPTRTRTATDANGFAYQVVDGDPMQARVYTLPNGLKVYLSVNREEPRFYSAIAVRAGSKNDPADHTGLAHYLEHMLFKGTDKFGTVDYEKERIYLSQIYALYEQFNSTPDSARRSAIYRQIDSVSNLAARVAVANEYDKMVSEMGSEGTNAFTSVEQTVYINNVPANQLERFLKLEAERFRNPVMRLFHTELETVYEEKNIGLDNANRQLYERLMAAMFPTHNYGQQTTIGTIEHLKNPSLRAIDAFFKEFYVANNMAISLAGDFNPDEAIRLVYKHWGDFRSGNPRAYAPQPERPLAGPVRLAVLSPEPEAITIAFRLPGENSRDAEIMELAELLLANGSAGLIDLNIRQAQKAVSASAYLHTMNDYSMLVLTGQPLAGQSLEQLEALLLEQVAKLKRGEVDPDLLKAVKRNLSVRKIRSLEDNQDRAFAMMSSFTALRNWEADAAKLERLNAVTMTDITRAANQYLVAQNMVVGYKRNGAPETPVKVPKPPITPVTINRDTASAFYGQLNQVAATRLQPQFLDFDTLLRQSSIVPGIKYYYSQNTNNQLFSLYYVFDFGTFADKELAFAINKYLPLLGTTDMSPAQFKLAMYKLGTSFGVNASNERSYVYISGLQETFDESVKLFEKWLNNLKGNPEVLSQLIAKVRKERADAKLQKGSILYQGLLNYGLYGERNPFNDVLSDAQLQALDPEHLARRLRELPKFQHRVFYFGPASFDATSAFLKTIRPGNATYKAPLANRDYPYTQRAQTEVLFVHYPMVQAEIIWSAVGDTFNVARYPTTQLFNEYFGGGMGSIVFQEIREAQALAYSASSRISDPRRAKLPHTLMAYVGTQADKLGEAIDGMNNLLANFIESPQAFEASKSALISQLESQRILREDVFFTYLRMEQLGLAEDLRKRVYDEVGRISIDDLRRFQAGTIANRKFVLLVMGDRDRLDMNVLRRHGPVREVGLETLFGY